MSFEGTACSCGAGVVHAGQARNVVPRRARIEGTLRTFDNAQLAEARRRIDELLAEVRERFAVEVTLDVPVVIPQVVNDERLTAEIRRLAGESGLKGDTLEPIAPSDDVSEFMRHIPGCHFFVGAMPKAGPVDHHTPEFDIDESVLEPAARLIAKAGAEWADPSRQPR